MNLFDKVVEHFDGDYVDGWNADIETDKNVYQISDFDSHLLITSANLKTECYSVDEALKVIK